MNTATFRIWPDADEVVVTPFENAFEKLFIDRNSFIVIVTRGHTHDKIALAQALKTDATYIGMIGSKTQDKTDLRFVD